MESRIEYDVYRIVNTINGKTYIGISKYGTAERWSQHVYAAIKRKSKYPLHHAIRKYGMSMFSVETIRHGVDKTQAIGCERAAIAILQTKKLGYNLTDGGDGTVGWSPSVEEKAKRAVRARELHLEKRIGMHGRHHSDETRVKQSKARKGRVLPHMLIKRGRKPYPTDPQVRVLKMLHSGIENEKPSVITDQRIWDGMMRRGYVIITGNMVRLTALGTVARDIRG